MPLFTFTILGTLLIAVLCFSPFLLLVQKQRANRRRDAERMVILQHRIAAALHDEVLDAARDTFSVTLKTASLTTGLQRPRLDTMAKIDKQPPEKYRILTKLASQGMDAEEIAAILGISHIEARQLLSLNNMAQIGR